MITMTNYGTLLPTVKCILFGLSPSLRTRDYWSYDAFLSNNYIKNIMTEKQFEKNHTILPLLR